MWSNLSTSNMPGIAVWTILQLCFIVFLQFASSTNATCVYVLPTNTSAAPNVNSSLCPVSECYSLQDLIINQSYIIDSNTTVVLLPGIHLIDAESSLKLNVGYFAIIGWQSENSDIPKILCSSLGSFQLKIENVCQILLRSFEIVGCNFNCIINDICPSASVYINIENINVLNTINYANKSSDYDFSIESYCRANITVTVVMTHIYFKRSCVQLKTDIHSIAILKTKMENIVFENSHCKYAVLTLENVNEGKIKNMRVNNSSNSLLGVAYSHIVIQGTSCFEHNYAGILLYYESLLEFDSNSKTTFEHNNCTSKRRTHCSTIEADGSKILLGENSHIIFRNNTGSSSGAITLSHSNLHMLGNSTMEFDSNFGANGGAISFYAGSQVLFCRFISEKMKTYYCKDKMKITVRFDNNHASGKGGAVYFDDSGHINSIIERIASFQDLEYIGKVTNGIAEFIFENNTANIAGNALYGGWLFYYAFNSYDLENEKDDLSIVASDPVRICICKSSKPKCSKSNIYFELYPGDNIGIIYAVAVGQRFGTVPSTVYASLSSNQKDTKSLLNNGQYIQEINRNCTALNYTVFPENLDENLTLELTVKKTNVPDLKKLRREMLAFNKSLKNELSLLMKQLQITLAFKPCPVGFTFNSTTKKCSCHPILNAHQIHDCDIQTLKINNKPSQKWINATFIHLHSNDTSGILVYEHCPHDYCVHNKSHISLDMNNPNEQCAFNRAGILCGECKQSFSHLLGSSRCKNCSNHRFNILFLLPVFAALGILLVSFLTYTNLTISTGMLNSLIFYANVVRANHEVFFEHNTFLSRFIAWLNLDLGFETCFYDKLDAYTKTWLQFLFPVYIWALVLLIIVTSRHYTFAARLSGSNAVQVLATLFLLSYAKLVRVVIIIIQPAVLIYPDGFRRIVWLYDGNVDYLKGKHILLFIMAIFILLFLSIPYTASLLFIQCLRRYNHYRILHWVGKMKPLFDAYTGPYKEKHCYWFGLLLLLRAALYIVFSLNVSGDSSNNLMAIGTTLACILVYLSQIGGVYESRLVNVVQGSLFLNLIILTMGTQFFQGATALTTVSVGLTFCLFVFIVLYHIYLRILETQNGKRVAEILKSKLITVLKTHSALQKHFTPNIHNNENTPFHSTIELREPLMNAQ